MKFLSVFYRTKKASKYTEKWNNKFLMEKERLEQTCGTGLEFLKNQIFSFITTT